MKNKEVNSTPTTSDFEEGLKAAVEKQRASIALRLIRKIMDAEKGNRLIARQPLIMPLPEEGATTPLAPTEKWLGIGVSPDEPGESWLGITITPNKPSDQQ